jgi:hypothetical protein
MDIKGRKLPRIRKKLAHTLGALLWYEDINAVETVHALLAILWGGWLLSPWWTTLEGFIIQRKFHNFVPEGLWGLCAVVLGVIWIWAVTRERYYVRRGVCLALCAFWSTTAVSLVLAVPESTSTVIYPLLAGGHAWVFWRLRLHLG